MQNREIFYREILREMSSGVIFVRKGKILYANPSATKFSAKQNLSCATNFLRNVFSSTARTTTLIKFFWMSFTIQAANTKELSRISRARKRSICTYALRF